MSFVLQFCVQNEHMGREDIALKSESVHLCSVSNYNELPFVVAEKESTRNQSAKIEFSPVELSGKVSELIF